MRWPVRSLHTQDYRRFAAFLAQVRQATGVTQQALATHMGKPQSFISKVERCERRLDVPEFIALARAMGHDPAELLTRIEQAIQEP